MNPLTITSFIIPAFVAIGLITLLIKERYHLIPKKPNMKRGEYIKDTEMAQNHTMHRLENGKQHPDDFLDLSGGALGI